MLPKRLIQFAMVCIIGSWPGLVAGNGSDPVELSDSIQDRGEQDAAERAAEQAERQAEAAREVEMPEPQELPESTEVDDGDHDQADDGDKGEGRDSDDDEKIADDRQTADGDPELSEAMMRQLAGVEGADHDDRGYPVRRGEISAIDLSAADLRAARAHGFSVIGNRRLPALAINIVRFSLPSGMRPADARGVLQRIAPKATIDLVHYYGPQIAAGSRPKRTKGAPRPAIASRPLSIGIVDSKVDSTLVGSSARLVHWQPGLAIGSPNPHGTAVAWLLAREGQTTIYAANIFRGPASRPFTSADVIADAVEWMLESKVPVINISLAGPGNAVLDHVMRSAIRRGATVVAAAGNGGPTAAPAYPAAVPGVVAVTAVDSRNRIYRHANRGRYLGFAAMGVDVVAPDLKGARARYTGTSFASPHVAGWLARCRSIGLAPDICLARLRGVAVDLGSPGFDEVYGNGLIR